MGERPSLTITRLVKGTNKNTIIPSSIGSTGQESSDPSVMAQDMLQYWEDLSNAGTVSSPEASAAVLTSVRDHSDSIPLPHTIILGAEDITPPEVTSALRKAKPGRSPGEDGITNELYSQFPDIFIPFSSRLYSVIGAIHSFPPSFSAGVINPFTNVDH